MKTEIISNRKSGFTLIELLISLAIIALMSGLSFAALNSARLTASDTRRVGDLKNVQGYLEIYYNKCGHYPGTADCSPTTTTPTWLELRDSLFGIVDKSRFPNDPISNSTYKYSYWSISDGSNYVLSAKLQTESKSIFKESYDGTDGKGYGSNCDKNPPALMYCIHS